MVSMTKPTRDQLRKVAAVGMGVVVAGLVVWTAWGVFILISDARGTSSFLSYLAEQRELEAASEGLSAQDREGLRAEAEAAQKVEAQIEAAIAQSLTALALLVVTALYVLLTYQLVQQARRDHEVALATLDEMRASREQELSVRRRDRSEAAALRALDAIQRSDIRAGRGEPENVKLACPELHVALEAEAPFIADDEVASRVDACQEAARVFAWPADQFKGYDHAMASIRIRQIVTVTRSTLEAYVAGRALPDWHDLPRRREAMNWMLGPRVDE